MRSIVEALLAVMMSYLSNREEAFLIADLSALDAILSIALALFDSFMR